jgi:CheY-like chemotaxis protein/anti-sigma regulatory factor (Ser/Thr protein kinase)
MATVGLLAAGVAHEINNPIAYVSLIIEQVSRELQDIAGAHEKLGELAALLAEAKKGTDRVGAIVRDLRTFSRPETSASSVADVRQVLESAIQIAQNEIRQRARLSAEIASLPTVAASEARLGQVFLNLLVNAVHSIPEGAPEQHAIRVIARQEGDRVRVEVSDTGCGIPKETLPRIFDPFFTTKPSGLGTGLGLSICKSILEAVSGGISVESEVGVGTTFIVTLPIRRVDSGREPPTEPSPGVAPRRASILVVDDEEILASALNRSLQNEHNVTIARTGSSALMLLLERSFDLVLCDIMMPEMTGIELYDEIQRRRPGLERRFLFMSGGACTPRVEAFLRRVDNPRLDKPFDMASLRELIQSALLVFGF